MPAPVERRARGQHAALAATPRPERTTRRRRSSPRVVVAVLAIAACGLAASGCGPAAVVGGTATRDEGPPVRGGTLRGAMVDNPDHLDPAMANTNESYEILEATNDGLLGFKRAAGGAGSKIIADLAEAVPKPTDGGRTYTFRLRPGVRFGPPVSREITASDVKASIQRLFLMNSPGIDYYTGIVGAEAFQKRRRGGIPGIVADDAKRTISFRLTEPNGTFLDYMAMSFASVLPKQTPIRNVTTLPQWRVATGPYRIAEYVPKDHITLERNPGFRSWTPEVPDGHLDKIELKIGVTGDQAVNEVTNGALDWYMQAVATGRFTEARKRFPDQVENFPQNNITYFSLNTRKPPLNDVRVRQAINYAVQRRALVKIFGGQGVPAENIVPPGLGAAYRKHDDYPYDLAKAKALVAASGTAGQSISVWSSNTDPQPKAAQYLASVLQQLGYKASVKALDESVYYDTMSTQKSNPQIQYNDWTQDYPEASNFVDGLLNGNKIAAVGNNDTSNLDVPALNARIERTLRMPLGPARDRSWAAIDADASRQDAPLVVFMNRTKPKFFSRRLHGLVFNPTYSELFPSMWLKD